MNENKKLLDLIWMMTAAGWSRSDILNLTDYMRSIPFSEVDELINHTKSVRQQFESYYHSGRGESFFTESPRKIPPNDVVEKVVYLLRDEAGLTTIEAINAVSKGLRKIDRIRSESLPSYSKQSLSQWVDRASQLFSLSELLFVATTVRNASVHGSTLDWNLRKNEP